MDELKSKHQAAAARHQEMRAVVMFNSCPVRDGWHG
jgi:hypothetical protein